MIEISDEDRKTPMTVADFKSFMNQLAAAFAAAPPPLFPTEGDNIVPPGEILELHSETTAEDGRTLRLYDLRDGGTGAQSFLPGDAHGPIRYC